MMILLGILLLLSCLIVPWLTRAQQRAERQFNEEMLKVRLRWTRKAYPELQELSYREIVTRYQIQDGYDRIPVRRQ